MTLLADLLGELASYVGANGLPIATIATVLLILAWGRRGMKYGGLVTGWARTAFIVALSIVVLLLTGVITGLDFGPILGAIKWLLELGAGLIGDQLAVVVLQAGPAGPPSWLGDLLDSVLPELPILDDVIGGVLNRLADVTP